MSTLGDKLKVVQANSFTFYLKTHYFHWNVEGDNFPQYHEFFENLYNEVWLAVDAIAEHIRTLDEYAVGSYKRFEELATIETIETVPDARAMFKALSSDNDKVMDSIVAAMQEAGKDPKHKGIENFMQDRLDIHNKHGWMIRSTLK